MAPLDFVPKAPERRADGKSWNCGPYVRLAERARWDAIYSIVADQLDPIVIEPAAVASTAAAIAYQIIWLDR